MKLLHIALIILATQTTACGPKRYIIDPMNWGRPVYIRYEDAEDLKAEEIKKAKVMMRPAGLNWIPAGGRIQVNIKAGTLAGANTKYWSTRVEDPQGKIIVEKKGFDSWPFVDVRASYPWSNIMIVDVPTYIDPSVTVRVFDHLSSERHDFTIEKRHQNK